MVARDEQLAMLVQPDRVHRSVYADAAIFELEMERAATEIINIVTDAAR